MVLWLHVGYPKCMSTTLQQYVFPKISEVSLVDENDPEIAADIHNLLTEPEKGVGAKLALSINKGNALLSREHFTSYQEYEKKFPALRSLSTWTIKNNISVVPFVVVRRQRDWWRSMFRFKSNYYFRPEDVWVNRSIDYLDYNSVSKRISRIFGNDQISLVKFEDMINSDFSSLSSAMGGVTIPSDISLPKMNQSRSTRSVLMRSAMGQRALRCAPFLKAVFSEEDIDIPEEKLQSFQEYFLESNSKCGLYEY